VAFYLPAVAFVDHYWRRVPLGKLRFIAGALVLIAASHFASEIILQSQARSIWEIRPDILREDPGSPPNCLDIPGRACDRLPLLEAVRSLREVSKQRVGLAEFVRNCERDRLIERAATEGPRRYCVANTPHSVAPRLLDDDACCAAQGRLVDAVAKLHAQPNSASMTGQVHAWLLPLKVFFLLVLLSISLLLTLRFEAIHRAYASRMVAIEVGLIIGTVSALFFPLMSQAFLQSLSVIAGDAGKGNFSAMVPMMSVAFGLWTFLIIIFFFRRNGDNIEVLTKIGSAAAGGIALIKYDVIVAYLVRIIGSGADWLVIAGVVVAAMALAIFMLRLTAHVTD